MKNPATRTDVISKTASFAPLIWLPLLLIGGGWRAIYFIGFMFIVVAVSFCWFGPMGLEDEPAEDESP